jgi:Cu/Zn superoxide dismutase
MLIVRLVSRFTMGYRTQSCEAIHEPETIMKSKGLLPAACTGLLLGLAIASSAAAQDKARMLDFQPAKEGKTMGQGHLKPKDGGVHIEGQLKHLPAGEHALVLMDISCDEALANTDTEHFQLKEGTGGLPGDKPEGLVAGGQGLLAIQSTEEGADASFSDQIDDLSLTGDDSISGQSVVVVANAYEKDRGASASSRLACASIP